MAGEFAMWGPEQSGTRLAERDISFLAKAASDAQHTAAQTNLLNEQAKLQPLHGDLYRAQAEKHRAEAARMQAWQTLARSASGGGRPAAAPAQGTGPGAQLAQVASQYANLSEVALGAGFVEEGEKAAGAAARLLVAGARADNYSVTQRRSALQAQQIEAQRIANLFGGVKSQRELDQANFIFQSQYGEASPLDGLTYDPSVIKQFSDAGVDRSKQIHSELEKMNVDSQVKNRNSEMGAREVFKRLNEAKIKLTEAREKNVGKSGGGREIAGPSKEDREQAVRLLKADFGDLPVEMSKQAGYDIAGEARLLQRRNPALSRTEAMNQAYIAAKGRGDFQTISEQRGLGLLSDSKKTIYSRPIPLPPTLGELQKGRRYISANGQTVEYLGDKKFRAVQAASVLSNPNASPNDADDDEDDD